MKTDSPEVIGQWAVLFNGEKGMGYRMYRGERPF